MSLSKSSFEGCKELKTVTVETHGMSSERKIQSDANIIRLPESCFEKCFALQSVLFNGCVLEYIDNRCFKDCISLNFNLNDGLLDIGNSAFYNCSSFISYLPNTISTIGEEAFSYAGLYHEFTIPNNIVSIERRAFYNTRIRIVKYCGTKENLPGDKSFEVNFIYVLKSYKNPTIFGCRSVGGLIPVCKIRTMVYVFRRKQKILSILLGSSITTE